MKDMTQVSEAEFAIFRHERGICSCRGPIAVVKDRFGVRRYVYERCPGYKVVPPSTHLQ